MRLRRFGGVCALLLLSASVAKTDILVSLDSYYYDTGNSVWKYTYGIDNSSGTEDIYSFWLDPIDVATIIGSPSYWDPGAQDDSIGGYVSWDAQDSHYLSAGGTLSGFELESPYSASSGRVEWTLYGDLGGVWEGGVDGPTVPEPGSMALLAMTGGGIALAVRRRRSKRKAP